MVNPSRIMCASRSASSRPSVPRGQKDRSSCGSALRIGRWVRKRDAGGKWLQWGIGQTVLLADELKKLGVDLVDVSSGSNWAAQKIPVVQGYQVRPSLPLSVSLGERRRRVGRSAPSLSLSFL